MSNNFSTCETSYWNNHILQIILLIYIYFILFEHISYLCEDDCDVDESFLTATVNCCDASAGFDSI